MIRKLFSRRRSGEGYPLVIAITLCLMLLFLCIGEYFRVFLIAQGVRDAVQQSVIATVNDNYDDVYHSVREGYAAGWFPVGEDDWEESLDTGDIYGNLTSILGLSTDDFGFVKYAGDEVEYTISNLDVTVDNNSLASGESEGYLATASIDLEVPMRFAGKLFPPARMTLVVEAKYVPKF